MYLRFHGCGIRFPSGLELEAVLGDLKFGYRSSVQFFRYNQSYAKFSFVRLHRLGWYLEVLLVYCCIGGVCSTSLRHGTFWVFRKMFQLAVEVCRFVHFASTSLFCVRFC